VSKREGATVDKGRHEYELAVCSTQKKFPLTEARILARPIEKDTRKNGGGPPSIILERRVHRCD